MAKTQTAEKLNRRAASERLDKMEALTECHRAWGGRLCLHPFTEPLDRRAFARQPSGSVGSRPT